MRASEYGLDTHYDRIQDEVRAVLDGVAPEDREPTGGRLSPLLVKAFAESNLSEHMVAARHGGRTETIDPLAVCVIREALMNSSSQLDALFSLQGIGSYALSRAGHPEVQQHWLPRIARGEALAAMALTEPHAGSDLKSITTTMHEDGDDLVISGHKNYISHASVADVITVFVREGEGYSLAVVPARTPGLRIEDGPTLIAPHEVSDLYFDEVRVPRSHRIGAPGEAFEHVLATLTVFRASVAGSAVGLAQAALDTALEHCVTREQFGRPLWKLGAVGALLADCAGEVEMARLLAYRAAGRAKAGSPDALDYSSMAKLATTEIACRVVDRCLQTMGRFGLEAEGHMAQLYLIARPLRIYEGANEVLRLGVARYLVGAR
ncbi:acyl-CoA dehydrogenase family protein [Sporichthya sp.]|uniref:acyl-CoA dehydrogenase family protein n=1 Tax=Sporichthya sp. TaxID=65475 RepID=UPI00182DEFBC|nr:acyl-CoA dehydrogenase family protein [Sporichthya sp.]MBA3743129.1 acyl-CoA dehydrogenase family protein [Sporichthya sp.]